MASKKNKRIKLILTKFSVLIYLTTLSRRIVSMLKKYCTITLTREKVNKRTMFCRYLLIVVVKTIRDVLTTSRALGKNLFTGPLFFKFSKRFNLQPKEQYRKQNIFKNKNTLSCGSQKAALISVACSVRPITLH